MNAVVSSLAEVERQARAARDLAGLAFSMTNDGWGLLGYRQALVMHKRLGRWGVKSVSGLVEVGETTPYQNWLSRLALVLESRASKADAEPDGNPQLERLQADSLPADLQADWQQWWPEVVHLAYLRAIDGSVNGLFLCLFEQPLEAARQPILFRLTEVWQHAWALLSGKGKAGRAWAKPAGIVALCLIAAALFFPVSQAVIAPAEIISLQSLVVSSPVDGVLKEVLVRPNQAVTANQALFALDDSSLRNRREVLSKSLGSAQAELLATTQKAFDSSQSRGDLAPLKGRVDERRAELAYIDEQLRRSVIVAPKAGIAVFGDPNDWRGRPISAGERVLLIADPAQLGVLIHVPVGDAIAIEPGAKIRLFLHVAPLKPLEGEVIETGYQALLSPDNVASYRVRASLSQNAGELASLSRIGLKGSAKILGPSVSLGYLLIRRPLAALREWTGQ